MQQIKFYIKDKLPEITYIKLIGRCIPYSEKEGGGFYKETPNGKCFLTYQTQLKSIMAILRSVGINLDIDEKSLAEMKVNPEEKAKMQIHFKILQEGIEVLDKNSAHFILIDNVSALLEIFQAHKEEMLYPRKIWAELVEIHKLFPEMHEIIDYLKKQYDIPQIYKDRWINELYKRQASAFEGLRVNKKNGLSYYELYWYPCLILRKLDLISQIPPNRELYLTLEGKEFINNNPIDNWFKLAKGKI